MNLQELKLLALRMIRRAVTALEQARSGSAAKPVEAAKDWIGRNLGSPITVKNRRAGPYEPYVFLPVF